MRITTSGIADKGKDTATSHKQEHEFRSQYPHYNVLEKWSGPDWDDQTRAVVRRRVEGLPPIRFFTETEARIAAAVAERIIPQPDRSDAEKVPIVPWIDEKLFKDHRDGYRYEDLPHQREAWRAGLAGIDETARILFEDRSFVELDPGGQDAVLKRMEHGDAPGESWTRMSSKRFFGSMLCTQIVTVYYAHPKAWNEIGYSGPASPRGHTRKWEGGVDPWDAREEDEGGRHGNDRREGGD